MCLISSMISNRTGTEGSTIQGVIIITPWIALPSVQLLGEWFEITSFITPELYDTKSLVTN